MADQPTKAMTLREAVAVVRLGLAYVSPGRQQDRYDRARAIVDAAVEAHEAKVAVADDESDDDAEALLKCEACNESFDKLRALERGEDA